MTALRLAFVLDATTKIEGKKLKGEIWERTVLRHVLAKVCMNVYWKSNSNINIGTLVTMSRFCILTENYSHMIS